METGMKSAREDAREDRREQGRKGSARGRGGGQGKDKGGTDAVQENTTGKIAERSGGKALPRKQLGKGCRERLSGELPMPDEGKKSGSAMQNRP